MKCKTPITLAEFLASSLYDNPREEPLKALLDIIAKLTADTEASPLYSALYDLAENSATPDSEMTSRVLMASLPLKVAIRRDGWIVPYAWSNKGDYSAFNDPYVALAFRLASWIVDKAEYYGAKLAAVSHYDADGLLGPVTSSTNGKTKQRTNDVPDSSFTMENYDTDDFASETSQGMSESSSSTDYDTPMARIREILDSYPEIVEDFTNDFERTFAIYEW